MLVLLASVLGGLLSIFVVKSILLSKRKNKIAQKLNQKVSEWKPEPRNITVKKLSDETYDILVIGGGSSGVGCALDASTRGLRVALVEAYDFGAETSSKSTKLLHGGVRYLERALRHLSLSQFQLVLKALSERSTIMRMAPFLTHTIKIMLPLYKYHHIPYYWTVLKLYDKISIFRSLGRSFFLDKVSVLRSFGHLVTENLVGAVVYHDGSFDDARLNVLLGATAAAHGAQVANHMRFEHFEVGDDNRIIAAHCKDLLTGKQIRIRAKGFISALGPFTDPIRFSVNPSAEAIIVPSRGTHIVLPATFCPHEMGFVGGAIEGDRLLYILPWKNRTLVGTTENVLKVEHSPVPSEEDVDLLCNEVQKYTATRVSRSDVLATWAGIRPLVKDLTKRKPGALVRNYSIILEKKNFIVVTGGKWTIFRRMACDVVNKAVKEFGLVPRNTSVTEYIELLGTSGYTADAFYELERVLKVDIEYAKHLLSRYGTRSFILGEYLNKFPKVISKKYLFREAEVIYCIDYEYACRVSDVLNSRFMVGYFDVKEAARMVSRVADAMGAYLGWSDEQRTREAEDAFKSLESLGLKILE